MLFGSLDLTENSKCRLDLLQDLVKLSCVWISWILWFYLVSFFIKLHKIWAWYREIHIAGNYNKILAWTFENQNTVIYWLGHKFGGDYRGSDYVDLVEYLLSSFSMHWNFLRNKIIILGHNLLLRLCLYSLKYLSRRLPKENDHSFLALTQDLVPTFKNKCAHSRLRAKNECSQKGTLKWELCIIIELA